MPCHRSRVVVNQVTTSLQACFISTVWCTLFATNDMLLVLHSKCGSKLAAQEARPVHYSLQICIAGATTTQATATVAHMEMLVPESGSALWMCSGIWIPTTHGAVGSGKRAGRA